MRYDALFKSLGFKGLISRVDISLLKTLVISIGSKLVDCFYRRLYLFAFELNM